MECSWGIKELIDAKNELKKALRKERNNSKRKKIRKLMESLDFFIEEEKERNAALTESQSTEILEEETTSQSLSTKELDRALANIEYDLTMCSKTYSLVAIFSNTLDKLQDKLHEIEEILALRITPEEDYAKITGATLTNNQALSLTNEFYKGFSPNLYPIFASCYAKRANSVRYVDKIENDLQADSIFIDIINRYFIDMYKKEHISKLYDFIHEYGHVISFFVNPENLYRINESFLNEVASLFPEVVAQYENKANFDPAQTSFESYVTLVAYTTKANNLVDQKPIVNIWNEHNRTADESYLEYLDTKYKIDQEELESIIDTSIDEEATYIISYMVALELLHIYKEDKERALKIYEHFLSIPPNQSLIEYLESEFTIGSHLEEEATELIDTFKLRLKKSGEFNV